MLRETFKICFAHVKRHDVALTTIRLMAGHSKWTNIKHLKAEKDGCKAVLFAKISRQIRLAIQEGNSVDPALNSTLRSVIDKAVKQNVPFVTIQNVLNSFQNNKLQFTKHRLGIQYKKKVFVICIINTNNFPGFKMDATAMIRKSGGIFVDVRHIFEDFGWIKAHYAELFLFANRQTFEEKVFEDAVEFGAEDVQIVDYRSGTVNFICDPSYLIAISKRLQSSGYCVEKSEHIFYAHDLVKLTSDQHDSYKVFLKKLQILPGVENIYDNVKQ
ncbi:probable transcriptional regulatory protein MYPU_6240 [Drosophila tropicalis]|uniref:probable transcriptional regulatory protein MYPU_6240 n=1 Tax=Drosophila tropicalis TaxID=46794 RepID=UPI0035ABF249